jgi:alpha-glucosidase
MFFKKVDIPKNFVFLRTESDWFATAEHQPTKLQVNSDAHSSTTPTLSLSPSLPSGEGFTTALQQLGWDVFRYSVTNNRRWSQGNPSQAHFEIENLKLEPSTIRPALSSRGGVEFFDASNNPIISSQVGQEFGVSGTKWIMCFPSSGQERFYGMGEKPGFERSETRTKFWNTDGAADFSWGELQAAKTDPMYISLPVLIIRLSQMYMAVVVNNPDAVFMNTGAPEGILKFQGIDPDPLWFFGSVNWQPDVFFLFAPDFPGIVRKVSKLQGTTPLPPLWALGHHQSRWGYKSAAQLEDIGNQFKRHNIPNTGLWLDIDYMDGYRVFTLNSDHFPDPKTDLARLDSQGWAVVPILDPGIKLDPNWDVYRDGKRNNIYCRNTEGEDYIGYVWPGETVYPDFSNGEVRNWWTRKVQELASLGFHGFWIDMNDPASGTVPLDEMRFDSGTLDHGSYHNQYALGMASATRRGLELAQGTKRPFVLSRSGFLTSSKYTAVWTGDNVSNQENLVQVIPISLSLSVSGLPFNGPDVPGFIGDASNELMRAWYKVCFLFPFLRNHNVWDATDQEPWTRDNKTTEVVTDLIRTRYKLLPYLYNLFIDQEEYGDPVLRPLIYHDDQPQYSTIADEFLVGPYVLQAPVLSELDFSRTVLLPKGRWFSLIKESWVDGPGEIAVETKAETTPIFFREGAIIPMMAGQPVALTKELNHFELLLCWHPDMTESVTSRYRFDDGITKDHYSGIRSEVEITLHPGKHPRVVITGRRMAFGPGNVTLVFLGAHRLADVEVDGIRTPASLNSGTLQIAGKKLKVSISRYWNVGVR